MGIYDRDYYREPSGHWSMGEYPGVYTLMGLAIAAFILELLSGNKVSPILEYGFCDYSRVLNGEVWRLLTTHLLFLKGGNGFLSLLISMFVLYMFGSELEGIYRTREFLAFVTVTALSITLFGTLAHLVNPQLFVYYVGFQGIVLALFMLYACHYPYRTIMLMFVIPTPTWVAAALFAAYSFATTMQGTPFIPVVIAVGWALLYHRFHLRITNLFAFTPSRHGRTRPKLYAPHVRTSQIEEPATDSDLPTMPNVSHSQTLSDDSAEESLEAKLDRVLAKVSREGRASLTASEMELLNQASALYKKRRG